MTLAAVGLFFSCSKENAEPQLQPSTQDAPGVTAVDPSTPGAIRLSLDADVAPFDVAQESFSEEEEGQSARGAQIVVGGPAVGNAITYKIAAEADGKVPVLLYIHDDNGITPINGARAEVTKDGKGVKLKLGALLDPAVATVGALKRLAEGKAKNPKISILVGQDSDNKKFTNKGPQLITYEAGKKTTLPDNFILLKAAGIPLKYDAASKSVSVADGVTVSLTMQGYLLGARFNNTYPSTMLHYRWDKVSKDPVIVPREPGLYLGSPKNAKVVARPPLGVIFRIDNLSATYEASIALNTKTNTFDIGEDQLNAEYQNPNILLSRKTIPGLAPSKTRVPHRFGTDIEHGTREREHFLDATDIGEFFIPVRTLDPNNFMPKEQFVVVYCPNPGDAGSIAYRCPMKLFYDDSPFSQILGNDGRGYMQPLKNKYNSFRKRKGLRPENKFHFVTFPIAPTPIYQSQGVWTYDREERFKAYNAALEKYGLK